MDTVIHSDPADGRSDGRDRAIIENVRPAVDAGRFAIKRVLGDRVVVHCDVFGDGHDRLSAVVRYRPTTDDHDANDWRETPLTPLGNDAWRGEFVVDAVGPWEFTILAWVDRFRTWRGELERREGDDDIALALVDGASLLRAAAARASADDAERLSDAAETIGSSPRGLAERRAAALDDELFALGLRYSDRSLATRYEPVLPIRVDDARAGFSAWYEFFPRSTAVTGQEPIADPYEMPHGTFADAIERLPYVAENGFDIVYFPPIHPIGRVNRKGRNNTLDPSDADVGVPYAIGAEEGGHTSVHPDLGTLDDFDRLVGAANDLGLEVALDIANTCAPDHPWVGEHPEWFRKRADGSVQYAENPPKKYQDIYPFDFETESWSALWQAQRDIFLFWLDHGVRIFRVDNPHTKPFAFWEWCIGAVKRERPDAIFLAEAFTRPKVMHRLAKLGFTHSYTYFTWRNTKTELEDYLLEVSQGPGREYFRPNFWPNTPDILHETLQHGGRAACALRYVLAATMSANYGLYGPVLELGVTTPREPGSEEYLDSEKYQLQQWRLDEPQSLAPLFRRINEIRREHAAFHDTYNASLHMVDNDALLCFSKTTRDLGVVAGDPHKPADVPDDTVLIVVNLDPHNVRAGWTALDLDRLGVPTDAEFEVHDLLGGETFRWYGPHNFVMLDPAIGPAHVLHVRPSTS